MKMRIEFDTNRRGKRVDLGIFLIVFAIGLLAGYVWGAFLVALGTSLVVSAFEGPRVSFGKLVLGILFLLGGLHVLGVILWFTFRVVVATVLILAGLKYLIGNHR